MDACIAVGAVSESLGRWYPLPLGGKVVKEKSIPAPLELPQVVVCAGDVAGAILLSRSVSARAWLFATCLILLLAFFAYRIGEVSLSGALAGTAISVALFAGAGMVGFGLLGLVFAIAASSSLFGRARKQALGIAENRKGRGGWQIIANLLVAAVLSLGWRITGLHTFLVAAVAALAEAAADTASSEIGKGLVAKAYLITSFRRVQAGIDGAISVAGTLAGVIAAAAIAGAASAGGLLVPREIALIVVAGAVGSFCDSLLGATLQRAGWFSNSGVNFVGTSVAAGFVLVLGKAL